MQTELKPLKVLSVYGTISLTLVFGLGMIAGLYVNPVYNSIQTQDLQRDLDYSNANLHQRKNELKAKQTLTEDFCKTYKTTKWWISRPPLLIDC